MATRGTTADIDAEELERLCALQCTDLEIAEWFKVSVRTIERRRKNPEFGQAMERGKARGRMSIRRAQMKMLEHGNAAMGIWLGKQYLGQADQIHHNVESQFYVMSPCVSVTIGSRDDGNVIDVAASDALPEPDELSAED